MRPAFAFLTLLFHITVFAPKAIAQVYDPVYAQSQHEVFKSRKVKQMRVEVEQFSNGQLVNKRHLHQRHFIDANGRTTRVDLSNITYTPLWTRRDTLFDAKGLPVTLTTYERSPKPGDNTDETPPDDIKWAPTGRMRFQKGARLIEGADRPDTSGNWIPVSSYTHWTKRDTTYSLKQELLYESRELIREYPVGKTGIIRKDYVSYSIPRQYGITEYVYSKAEPKFYYRKVANGRTIESGSVDFETELQMHLEKHPKDQKYLLGSERRFHILHDKVARTYPGTLRPIRSYTYSPKGLLLERNEYELKHTFERDPEGRIVKQTLQRDGQSVRIITFTYNQHGLLETEKHTINGAPEDNRYYFYSFY